MNLVPRFIAVLLLALFFIPLSSIAANSTWTRYQNYKIHLDAPEGWIIERDLYGMPIMVLGPERDGERAVLSVQHTPIRNLEFDHALIQKTKNDYYEGRKNWVENLGDNKTTFLSELPYRHLKWTNGNDGFEIGFRYHARGIDLEERSIQVNCGKRLFLFKTLSNSKLPPEDKQQLAKFVNELDCVATTAKDGAYEPSELQDYDRKFKDAMLGSVWPTKKQIKDASVPARALMIEAVIHFYKDFEEAGGQDVYAANKNPVENQFFAKIRDRMDRIVGIIAPGATAAGGNYDCFFGGWPSKFLKRGSGYSCGYPWETNPTYTKSKSSCGEGTLSCNPTLFGDGVCVDVSSSQERAHATLSCEMKFRASGKSFDDIAKSENFDQANLEETINSAQDVCSQEPYASENYGLCSTLKEKLGMSINTGKHAQDEEDVKFINGLDEMKPENFDQYVSAVEKNYKEFEARCIDEKGELKIDEPRCPEDHLAILQDLEKIDKRYKDLGLELQQQEPENEEIVNQNCTGPNCSDPVDPLNPKVNSAKHEVETDPSACTPEQVKRKKERECSWSKGMFMAGSCVWNVVTSLVSSIWGTIKAIGELIWDGVKWVGNKFVQAGKWFIGLFGYEDESSKKVNTAAQTNNSAIKSFKKDPTGSAINFFKTIYDGVSDFVANDVACEKWSGVAHFSKCLIPATSWKCQPCLDRVDTVCSSVGYLVGEIAPAFVTGGMTTAIKGTATAAKITKYMGEASRLGKLTRIETKLLKGMSKGKKTASTLSAMEKKVLKTSASLTKKERIIAKTYNIARWPVKKYRQIQGVYVRATNAIKGFKSRLAGKFKPTLDRMRAVRDKNFVTKAGVWLLKGMTVTPTKAVYKVVTAPVRLPYKGARKYVSVQEKTYQAGLKYSERFFNQTLVKEAVKPWQHGGRFVAGMNQTSKFIAKYGSSTKYAVFSSHMLDEFRERLSMKDEERPTMFWASSKDIENQAKAERKNPEQVKAALKQNRINQVTKQIVNEAWAEGKEPKEIDLQHLVKISGLTVNDLRLTSIDERMAGIQEGKTPVFSQNDYVVLGKEWKVSPEAAKTKLESEVKIQIASQKVLTTLVAGQKPDENALKKLAELRGVTPDDIIMETINTRLMQAIGGIIPVFTDRDYEVYARTNGMTVEQAKQDIDQQINTPIGETTMGDPNEQQSIN